MLPNEFLDKIVAQHQQTPPFPATSDIKKLFTKIVLTLFPEQTRVHFKETAELVAVWESIENGLESLLHSMKDQLSEEPAVIAQRFLGQIPAIYDLLQTDVEAMVAGERAMPAAEPGLVAADGGRDVAGREDERGGHGQLRPATPTSKLTATESSAVPAAFSFKCSAAWRWIITR